MTTAKPYHLFLVEDDPDLRSMLTTYLEQQQLVVTSMNSAEEFLRRMDRLRPDLVILDLGLPNMSGLQACQKLRAEGDQIPIVLLTAKVEEVDRVIGLESGADDYLGKPFSARELLARIHAVLRRAKVIPGLPKPGQTAVVFGGRQFDPASRTLQVEGISQVLNTIEFTLLAELVANPNVPISRERLLAASHDRSEPLLLRTVDTGVMRLRKLIEPIPAQPRYIQTVRSRGYMFVPS